jgi:endonuclease YncB( thermonuclease family)
MDLPTWWSSTHNPWKRVMLQFKGVGLRMWHTLVDDVVTPGLKGDLRPAAAYAAVSAGVGGAGQRLMDAIKGEDTKEAKQYAIDGALANVTNNFIVQTLNDVFKGNVSQAILGVSGRTAENIAKGLFVPTGKALKGDDGFVESADAAVKNYGKAIPEAVRNELPLVKKISQHLENNEDRADAEKVFRVINDLPEGEIMASVQKVIDGDTLRATLSNGKTEDLRLNNIDAPEHDQSRGQDAAAGLEQYVGKDIKINPKAREHYGRLIVSALSGDKDINLEQVKRGLAWHSGDIARDQALMERIKYSLALHYAKLARNGVWGDEAPVEPSQFREAKKANERAHRSRLSTGH